MTSIVLLYSSDKSFSIDCSSIDSIIYSLKSQLKQINQHSFKSLLSSDDSSIYLFGRLCSSSSSSSSFRILSIVELVLAVAIVLAVCQGGQEKQRLRQMSFASLPMVDLQADESAIIQSMFEACSTTGFFYLRNHPLRPLQERMFDLAKEFFRLPSEIKEKHLIDQSNHGYVRRGQENLDSTNKKLIDEKEAFNFGRSIESDQLPAFFSQGDHLDLIRSFFRQSYDLCMKLLTYLARCFSIDENYFTDRHQFDLPSGNTLRLLHYPAVDHESEESIRAGAHSDYGSLTLLFQHDQKSGLQVLDRANDVWYPVQPFDEMIVVNFGDAIEYWSNGFIKSTVHRVIMPKVESGKNNERYTIAFFCHPNDSALLTPIPSPIVLNHKFDKDAHAKHALDHENETTLTAGEHLQMRLNKTYTY